MYFNFLLIPHSNYTHCKKEINEKFNKTPLQINSQIKIFYYNKEQIMSSFDKTVPVKVLEALAGLLI